MLALLLPLPTFPSAAGKPAFLAICTRRGVTGWTFTRKRKSWSSAGHKRPGAQAIASFLRLPFKLSKRFDSWRTVNRYYGPEAPFPVPEGLEIRRFMGL